MYLSQLPSCPLALTFSRDGKELAYSMGSSLWCQTIGGDQARELTDAGGLRLPPRLVTRWSTCNIHPLSERPIVVAARSANRQGSRAHFARRYQSTYLSCLYEFFVTSPSRIPGVSSVKEPLSEAAPRSESRRKTFDFCRRQHAPPSRPGGFFFPSILENHRTLLLCSHFEDVTRCIVNQAPSIPPQFIVRFLIARLCCIGTDFS